MRFDQLHCRYYIHFHLKCQFTLHRPRDLFKALLVSDDNADQTAFAVVDNFLHGILQLDLAFLTDLGNFRADSVLGCLTAESRKNLYRAYK